MGTSSCSHRVVGLCDCRFYFEIAKLQARMSATMASLSGSRQQTKKIQKINPIHIERYFKFLQKTSYIFKPNSSIFLSWRTRNFQNFTFERTLVPIIYFHFRFIKKKFYLLHNPCMIWSIASIFFVHHNQIRPLTNS
jgi:hypothetical protein